jgi:hypothetical protein
MPQPAAQKRETAVADCPAKNTLPQLPRHTGCTGDQQEKYFMLKITRIALVLSLAAGSALSFAACGVEQEIENEIDCQEICQRYSDCFDADYEVSACQDRCESDVDSGELTFDEVDACSDCIDDRSCASGTLSCATECVGIVP